MQFKTFRLPIILLTVSALIVFSNLQALAQSRTTGNSRNPGSTRPAVTTPIPAPEVSRDIGRTRQPQGATNSNPPSNGSRDNGRSNSGLPSPVSTIADIVPPVRPQRVPVGRPPAPIVDLPKVIIVDREPIGGCILIGGNVDESGEAAGFWIREDVRYGRDVTLAASTLMPEYSGYDFSELMKRSFDHPFADMFVEEDVEGRLMMSVREDTEIMDIGAVYIPENMIYVPRQEWASTQSVLLIPGHEYVVQTWDHHYAKFVVTSVLQNRVIFDWAYQYGVQGDPPFTAAELRTPNGGKFQR